MDTIKNKKILVLLDNQFTHDNRVYRESVTLAAHGYDVTLLATKKAYLKDHETVDNVKVFRVFNDDIFNIKKPGCFKQYAKQITEEFSFDIIHANDQTMLHLAARIKKLRPGTIVIYDSHELFHDWPINLSNYNNLWLGLKSYVVRKMQVVREKRNRQAIDYLITVNQSVADNLKHYFKLKHQPAVIRNLPEPARFNSKRNTLRQIYNIPENTRILVFIGANIYAKTLNLEQVLNEFHNRKNTALVFIASKNMNSKAIMEYVKNNKIKNVFFHDLIKPSQIPEYLSSADVGLVPTWNKKNLSYWYALDNKLFEYIHAGIPVLATKQPEYANIVETYDCGVCVNPDTKNAYLNGFETILNHYDHFQTQAKKAAKQLNWENEQKKLVALYDTLDHYIIDNP